MKTKLLRKIRRKYDIGIADITFYNKNKEIISPCCLIPIKYVEDTYYFYKKKKEKTYFLVKNTPSLICRILGYIYS